MDNASSSPSAFVNMTTPVDGDKDNFMIGKESVIRPTAPLMEEGETLNRNTEPPPSNSKWSLLNIVTTTGQQLKTIVKVMERKLGSSSREKGDGLSDRENLLDPHDGFQRSYGSVSPSSGIRLQTPPFNNNNNSRVRRSSESRRRRVDTFPVQSQSPRPPFSYQGQNFLTLPPTDSHSVVVDRPSSAGPTLTVPTINIEQEDDSVNMDGNSKGPYSSGFNSGHQTPLPTSPSRRNSISSDFESDETANHFTVGRYIKIGILMMFFVAIAGVITVTNENVVRFSQVSISKDKPYVFPLKFLKTLTTWYPIMGLMVKGAFVPPAFSNFTTNRLIIQVEQRSDNWREDNSGMVISDVWDIPIFSEKSIGIVPETMGSHAFNLEKLAWGRNSTYVLVFRTNMEGNFPMAMSVKMMARLVESGALLGGLVILGLYILIIFELVNRTLSAILAATTAIGILAIFDERPTTEEMVSWLDMETLILLFSMMVLVSILCETGFFDYCAYLMYKLTNGQVWPMITSLCLFTAIVSAFLDNVTTILLMTPVTIRICEAMELNPIPILISVVIFSNIGGACTPVGDPPNVIISNNEDVKKNDIDFSIFTTHMLLGIIPVVFVSYLQLRYMFRSMKSLQFSEPYAVAELRREVEVWTRAADSLSSYSKDENHVKALLMSKVVQLKTKLKAKIKMGGQSEENYKANLQELRDTCCIRDWPLLIKCGIVLSSVIVLFFLHSVPQLNLSMGWTALLGAVLLLILADPKDLEGILSRVEWSTLIFFSALFIVMEGVSRLGLLEWIGNQTENIILDISTESRLTVAILLILWVSGIASAFIDNIPFTTMMVKIVTRIASNLSLPLQPLIWALAFGTCLGGNGTLIGASANVVCAGVADQHGYRFTFMEYFRIGFPMMLVSLVVASGYLLFCHSFLSWND